MNPKISVIMPVYNSAKYLSDSIQSVLEQTFYELELIIVDDGSNDESLDIARKFEKKDERIQVFSQQNMGPSVARNKGVRVASSDLIFFIDSDDLLYIDILKCLYNYYCDHEAEIILCETKIFSKRKDLPEKIDEGNIKVLDGKNDLVVALESPKLEVSVCGNLYGRSLLEKNPFKENVLFEDLAATVCLLKQVNTVLVIEKEMYFYRKRPSSIMTGGFLAGKMGILEITEDVKADFSKYEYRINQALAIKLFQTLHHVCWDLIFSKMNNKMNEIHSLTREMKELATAFPNFKRARKSIRLAKEMVSFSETLYVTIVFLYGNVNKVFSQTQCFIDRWRTNK